MRTKLWGVLVAGLVGACGGAVTNDVTNGSPNPSPSNPPSPGQPPDTDQNEPLPPQATEGWTVAVERLFLGETDRSGVANKDAWKAYGRNVDGVVSTKDSVGLCQRVAGASSSNQADGNNGIDNAFGKVIIPFIAPFLASPSKTASAAIAAGARTAVFMVDKSTSSVTNVGFSHLEASSSPNKTRSLAEPWTVNGGAIAMWQVGPSGDTVRSRSLVRGPVVISIPFGDQSLVLPINVPEIEASKDWSSGTLSGVVPTEAFIAAFERVAGAISAQLCGGSTIDSIRQTIRQASDILADGTQDPNQPCNGLSIGIGFEAAPVVVAGIANAPAPTPDPCK